MPTDSEMLDFGDFGDMVVFGRVLDIGFVSEHREGGCNHYVLLPRGGVGNYAVGVSRCDGCDTP